MTDVRDPEEVSYGDLFLYFNLTKFVVITSQIQSNHRTTTDRFRLEKKDKKQTLNRNHISHQNVPEKRK